VLEAQPPSRAPLLVHAVGVVDLSQRVAQRRERGAGQYRRGQRFGQLVDQAVQRLARGPPEGALRQPRRERVYRDDAAERFDVGAAAQNVEFRVHQLRRLVEF
jgi:hypothetical protein